MNLRKRVSTDRVPQEAEVFAKTRSGYSLSSDQLCMEIYAAWTEDGEYLTSTLGYIGTEEAR